MKSVQHAIRNRLHVHRHDKHHEDHTEESRYHKGQDGEKIQLDYHNFNMSNQKEADESSMASTESLSTVSEVIAGSHDTSSNKDFEDKTVYEAQLTQLQEQLVTVMIENQALHAQVQDYENSSQVNALKEQLEAEQEKCEQLHLQLLEEKKKGLSAKKLGLSSSTESVPEVEIAEPATNYVMQDGPDGGGGPSQKTPPPRRALAVRLWECVFGWVYELLEDLEPLEPKGEEDGEGPPLTVKQLKENIKRFKTALTPYINTFKGIHRLMTWKSPAFTLLVFGVYMYTVYQGLFLPCTLFLLTFRLGINYLRHRGMNINFNYLDPGEEDKKDAEEKGMSDKFNLVLFVARKVQNVLGTLADSLEKIKNLFIWEQPEATSTLFFGLFFGFVLSLIFETGVLFYLAGLYLGVKLFVIDYFFNRYPRLKRKRDTVYKIWLSLPTDIEKEKRSVRSEIDKYILPQQQSYSENEVWSESQMEHMTRDDKSFCELFSLPLSECPLPGWHGGKRCTLINKDKSITGAFKNGRLYLTRSFLCFERSKTPTPKNIVIPLCDIAHIEKAKPYSWMPGGGMAIEITLVGSDKTFTFGALLNRDEVFYSIVCLGKRAQLNWAKDPELIPRRHSLEN
ncbi:GRAM domain-containing protein 4-like isoform X2 [Liolophura sinensis]|uniref:GRAM domain-containing protein 4-like isoform X2 n=1 Tax=Liolophura sinensis TaxID=3198878 RepID=UPI003158EB20